MLFFENLIRALLIFNGLWSRYCQRALLVYHYPGALHAAGGVVTALAWIVLDPLLATTEIHRRRLDRFVTVLGEELRGGRGGAYRVRDHYIARVFDVLEMLRAATTAFR